MPFLKTLSPCIGAALLVAMVSSTASVQAQSLSWSSFVDGGEGDPNARVACGLVRKGRASMTIDASGHTIVTGCSESGSIEQSLTLKIDPAGDIVWSTRTMGRPTSVVVDASADVFLATGSQILRLAKLSGGTGEMLWEVVYGPLPDASFNVVDVKLDSVGNVLIHGDFRNSQVGRSDARVFKFRAADGELLWMSEFEGSTPQNGPSIAVDAQDNVYLTGGISATGGSDILTAKYAGDTGEALWQAVYQEPETSLRDDVVDLRVDQSGDVVIVGYSYMQGTGTEMVAIKYSGHDGTPIWTARNAGILPYALAISPDGDVLAAGSQLKSDGRQDYAVFKYAGDSGSTVWQQFIEGPLPVSYPVALTVSDSGDALVTGRSELSETELVDSRMLSLRLAASDGGVVWQSEYGDGTAPALAHSIQLHESGDAIVAGSIKRGSAQHDFQVIRYRGADGDLVWAVREGLAGRDTTLACGHASAVRAMAVDATGATVVTGCADNDSDPEYQMNDYMTAKFSADGSLLWRTRFPAALAQLDSGRVVAIDANNDVITTGISHSGGTADFLTAKYAGSTGAPLWVTRFEGIKSVSGYGNAFVNAMAMDSAGDVVVVGSASFPGARRIMIIKYHGATGDELWQVNDLSEPSGFDSASVVAFDQAGDVLVSGVSDSDWITLKLSGSTGTQIWEARARDHGSVDPVALHIDAAGDIVVSGTAFSAETSTDFLTIKYSGISGAEVWVSYLDGSGGLDLPKSQALDAQGNVVVTGSSFSANGHYDVATVKYDGVDGTVQWSTRYDGPFGEYDSALAMGIDQSGDVVVLTRSRAACYTTALKVVKYDGLNGSEISVLSAVSTGSGPGALQIAGDNSIRVAAGVQVGYQPRIGVLRIDDLDPLQRVFATGFEDFASGPWDCGSVE